MADTQSHLQTDEKHHLQVYKRYPIVLDRGKGSRVWDVEGNEYLDAFAGIAVNSVGHCHPKVTQALQQQAEKLIHVSNFFATEPQVQLAKRLTKLSGLDKVFFTNSGAEAVEGAFKMARKYSHGHKRSGAIISMQGCFHGRTIATIAPGKEKYQKGFGPIPEGFRSVPFNDIQTIQQVVDKNTAAVIIEPVQGEGGVHVADQAFLKDVRQLCDDTGSLLILDEIQCGIGRTGQFFAYEHFGIEPDILTVAKALGGGAPIGAFLVKDEIAESIGYGEHGTTFGGNPLVTAAGLATLNIIEEENLVKAAQEKGDRIKKRLEEAAQDTSAIKDVRGLGLMIGVELNFKGKPVVDDLMDKGILANCAANTVIRLVPALNIDDEDLDTIVDELLKSIETVQ